MVELNFDVALNLKILVGTMTGSAQMCAEDIVEMVRGRGHEAEMVLMDRLDAGVFQPGALYLICTSTYGEGDVPDNAQQLYDELCTSRPDLGAIEYGVIALGDSTYTETFTFGGKRFDTILSELNATRIGALFQHDADSGTFPEEEAVVWAEHWIAALEQAEAAE